MQRRFAYRFRFLLLGVVALVSVTVFAVARSQVLEKADADRDGLVTTGDLFDFAEAFREHARDPETGSAADLDGDGQVDERDIFRFLRLWNRDREESLKEYEKGS